MKRKALSKMCVRILILLFCVTVVSPVPMVENSVKFALERCKQFLHLATFLREDALQQDQDGIGKY